MLCIQESHTKVQEASCDALQSLIDNASFILQPYIDDVLKVINNLTQLDIQRGFEKVQGEQSEFFVGDYSINV